MERRADCNISTFARNYKTPHDKNVKCHTEILTSYYFKEY